MKKLTYLFVAAAALGMVACGGNKPGYVITGTVEGAADGDTVFLQEVVGRQLSKLDTAIIKNGTFTSPPETLCISHETGTMPLASRKSSVAAAP